jgi:RimJ/RimL family protein N-acetyltransferase
VAITHEVFGRNLKESRPERVRCDKANNQVLKQSFQKSDGTTPDRVPMDESFIYFKENMTATSEHNWTIRQPTIEDAETLASMHAESFRFAYLRGDDSERDIDVLAEAAEFVTPERLEQRRLLIEQVEKDPETELYQMAVNQEGQCIGLVYGFKEDDMQELSALYVDEAYFGAGVAQALVGVFKKWCDPDLRVELGVVEDNERAKRFYAKMGFEALGDKRESYYPFLQETTMVIPKAGEIKQ